MLQWLLTPFHRTGATETLPSPRGDNRFSVTTVVKMHASGGIETAISLANVR